jgi:hypothetical protein
VNPFDRVLTFVRIVKGVVQGDRNAVLVNVATLLDDQGNESGGQDGQEIYTGVTYLNPDPPDTQDKGGTCCEGIALKEDDGCTVVAYRDLRLARRVKPAVGELGLSHYGGGFLSLAWDADHKGTQVVLLAPRLDSNGAIDKSHGITMDPTVGNANITIQHIEGGALVLDKDGSAKLTSGNGKHWVHLKNDGFAMSADSGYQFVGGVVAGNTSLAREVPLHQEVSDALTTIATALGLLSTQIMAPPQAGAGAAAQVAQLATQLAALATTGKATTLKASPL